MRRSFAVAFVLGVAAPGCSINLAREQAGAITKNECSSDSDCGDGACQSGICAAHEGKLKTLLVAVTPPTDALGVGGARFLQLKTDWSRSNEAVKLDIHRVSTVTGFVRTTKACAPDAAGTLPVEVTLTPHETSYGLSSVSYVAQAAERRAESEPAVAACRTEFASGDAFYAFKVTVPAGSYDAYARPLSPAPANAGDGGVDACSSVPELFSNVEVLEGDNCLPLPVAKPQLLDAFIQWPDSTTTPGNLDGWTLDMVHPITGHRISEQLVLHGDAPDNPDLGIGRAYHARIHYSSDDSLAPGKEVVRLSPPEDVVAPVVQFERSGIEATTPARTPVLGVFPAPVSFESWLWRADEYARNVEAPVPGSVTFTAQSLDGVAEGVVASFTTTVQVAAQSPLQAKLLPGSYRVDVLPLPGLGLAALEVPNLDVSCPRDPAAPDRCLPRGDASSSGLQAGHVFFVQSAASITGVVVDPVHHSRLDGATVEVEPAAIGVPRCEGDAGSCASRPLHVFDTLLGKDAFVPRSATDVAENGEFSLAEVDCGGCVPGDGTVFDLTVRPPEGSRFPWLVHPGVEVDGGVVALPRMTVSLPVVQRGIVEVPVSQADPIPIARALIRAYVLRDERGEPVDAPEGIPSCSNPGMITGAAPAHCIRSVLQVAETTAAEDGSFELLLPSELN